MSARTQIEWCDSTHNPWWGCAKISPACDFCYASSIDSWRTGGKHWGPGAPRRTFGDEHWNEPRRWDCQARKRGVRHRVFAGSMCDVFDAEAPAGELDRLWALIRETPNLDWLLLTKRPRRIAKSLPANWDTGWPNVWLGTTVENAKFARQRIPALLAVPAAVHFLSCEPLLEALDLRSYLRVACYGSKRFGTNTTRVDWIICGGESGASARPMHPDWARSMRDQCRDAAVPFFFKQWGTFDEQLLRLGKKRAGRVLDGVTHDELPVAGRR